MTQPITIATRKSPLALWQAETVQAQLPNATLLAMSTEGDEVLDKGLNLIGGKGLFTKNLETALLDGRADMAVHSAKDVPSPLPAPFCLAAFLERESPKDAFVSTHYARFEDLPKGSIIGTSSLRRQAAILRLRPDLIIKPLRGNVQTRLAKLERGEVAAIVLAEAALHRLGLAAHIRHTFDIADMLPAAGQGVIAVECVSAHLSTRADIRHAIAAIHCRITALCITTERAVIAQLNGSCRIPIAAHAVLDNHTLHLTAWVMSADGQTRLVASGSERIPPNADDAAQIAETLGARIAEDLREQGADAIIARIIETT